MSNFYDSFREIKKWLKKVPTSIWIIGGTGVLFRLYLNVRINLTNQKPTFRFFRENGVIGKIEE